MCSSDKVNPAASRPAAMASVTLASGALAGVMPTAGIRPVSRSRSTCRLQPSNSTERDLRPCRIWPSSTLIRRSSATPRRSAGAGPGQIHVLVADLPGGRHRLAGGLIARLAGDERPDLIQQAQHPGQGRIPGGRVRSVNLKV
jgi:hypothetical protein